jgi:putative 4-mercaptohistidine N1-methyltranferase
LARHCGEVIGIDFSHRFIQAANHLREHGFLGYDYIEEGCITSAAVAEVPVHIERGRVRFEQGDAQALRDELGQFDVVLMANLVDRLSDPRQCLSRLSALVKHGGQLILTTPCTWLQEYTPPSKWLGGFVREGKPVRALDGLRESLEPHFELAQVCDLPFLIREHARKYQWSVAQASTWIRGQSSSSPSVRMG